MRKFRTIVGLACVLVAVTSFSASAASCASPDYAELQDMSVAELVKDFCIAINKADDTLLAKVTSTGYATQGEVASQMVNASIEQCRNQAERMRKMLVRKGVEESGTTYKVLCEKK